MAFGQCAPQTIDQSLPEFPATEIDKRYVLVGVKRRLHQALFRQIVLCAYNDRCALSGLPEPQLLDAAHIIPDSDANLGQPIISNGLLLSKIHHAAFDRHLLGIDQDYRLRLSDRLRKRHDGPTLEALKSLDKTKIRLPARPGDYPDPDRLKERFKIFCDTY